MMWTILGPGPNHIEKTPKKKYRLQDNKRSKNVRTMAFCKHVICARQWTRYGRESERATEYISKIKMKEIM